MAREVEGGVAAAVGVWVWLYLGAGGAEARDSDSYGRGEELLRLVSVDNLSNGLF